MSRLCLLSWLRRRNRWFRCGQLDSFSSPDAGTAPDAGPLVTAPIAATDILFVIDNSGSMLEEQFALIQGFDGFIEALRGGDYRIAVISTDVDSVGDVQRAGRVSYAWSNEAPYYRLLLEEFSTAACYDTTIPLGCFFGPEPERRVVNSQTMTEAEQIEAFAKNADLGTCGSGRERAFDALMRAYEQRHECNQGFFREEAHLVVIFVSDEEEAGMESPNQRAQELLMLKSDPTKIRVATIVGGSDSGCAPGYGSACGSICNSSPPEGSLAPCDFGPSACPDDEYCDSGVCRNAVLQNWNNCESCTFYKAEDCCTAVAGRRYVDFALAWEATVAARDPSVNVQSCTALDGAGVCLIASACQESYASTLRLIALTLIPRAF